MALLAVKPKLHVAEKVGLIVPFPLFDEARFEARRELKHGAHTITLERPEDYVSALGVRDDESARRWVEMLAHGDPIAIMAMRRAVYLRRRQSFSPYTDTYNSGSGTITAPANSSNGLLRSYGGGGAGGWRASSSQLAGGGGGAGFCETSAAIAAGAQLGYVVGSAGIDPGAVGSGGAGSATTTASGTGGFSGIAHNAGGGGGGGATGGAGTAGASSGGTTNTNGAAGQTGAVGANGGDCLGTGGGLGGVGNIGASPGGGGAGGNNIVTSFYGGDGRFSVGWT